MTETAFSKITGQFDTSSIPQDAQSVLNDFDRLLQGVRPLNSKQLQQLPENIRALSHQLTDERATRRLGYLNSTVQLVSYARYYTWWNLVRLTRLLANLPGTLFPDGAATCLDVGSGPLTMVCALWLARPELRGLPLIWYCLDVSQSALALGEDIYLSTVARTGGEPWKIIRVRGSFGTPLREKADFITCANLLNELDQSGELPPEAKTKKYFEQLTAYAARDARFLLVEPGVPKASRTLSLLRERFIKNGNRIAAPCTHAAECPMNGFKAYTGSQHKWCNFAFSTENAPVALQKLSERARLPKERATLSFLAVLPKNAAEFPQNDGLLLRVTSDAFRLPHGRIGHYACSRLGLTLLNAAPETGFHSGDLISVKTKTPNIPLPKDEKSGAVIIKV